MDVLEKLAGLEQESIARGIPIIGHAKGEWLLQIVETYKPLLVLELGTANGYSGVILGSAGARLITIEQDATIAEEARSTFSRFGVNAEVLVGDGVILTQQIAKEKAGQFDLIFIDFAKKKYIAVLPATLRLLHPGGVLIADNITMPGCQDFTQAILHHPQLQTEIIPIGDGLSYSVFKRADSNVEVNR